MSETLVIRLRASEEAPASWLIVDRQWRPLGSVHTGPLADALSLARGPLERTSAARRRRHTRRPELPLRGGARLAQAVPFALEEQLASELETCTLRSAPESLASAGTPVAMSRATAGPLAGRLWDAAGIHSDAAYAESGPVPSAPGACSCCWTRACCSCAVPMAALCTRREPFATGLDLALGEGPRPARTSSSS